MNRPLNSTIVPHIKIFCDLRSFSRKQTKKQKPLAPVNSNNQVNLLVCRAPVGACLRSNLLRKSSPAKAGSIRPVIFENRKYKNLLKTLVAQRHGPCKCCKTDIGIRRPVAQAAAASREGAGFRPAPRRAGPEARLQPGEAVGAGPVGLPRRGTP
jgi:hypothetical protein